MFVITDEQKIDFTVNLVKTEPVELALGSNLFYFYTNILNLYSFLSSGFIYPFSKNEDHDIDDLSSSNGKGLLLFRNPVSYQTCLEAWKEKMNVPVVLVINLYDYKGQVYAINKDYLYSEKIIDKLSDHDTAIFIPGCIPLSVVENIYVNDENHIKFFLSKKELFGEVPLDLITLKASDAFFGSTEYDVLTLRALIKSLDFPIIEYRPGNIKIVLKYIAFFTAAFRFTESSKNLRLILDFITLLTLLPACDMKDFTERYKKIRSKGLDYENFRFEHSFYLLVPIIGVRYSNSDILDDFKLFLKEIPSRKKPETEDIIKYFLNFTTLRLLLLSSGEQGDIKNEIIKKFENEFTAFVKGTKKVTKKIADKFLKTFKEAEDILESKKDLESVSEWSTEFNPIKLLLLLSFNDDFERSVDLKNDKVKYSLSDSDIHKLILFSAIRNGIVGMKADYKTDRIFLSGIISVLLELFHIGRNLNKVDFIPSLESKKIDSVRNEYSISGLDNLDIRFSITEKREDLSKKISSLIPKLNSSEMAELASAMGFEDLVETEINFEGDIAYLSWTDEITSGKRRLKLIVKGNPNSIKYKVDSDGLLDKINQNLKILMDRKDIVELIEKYRIEKKK
jgi:hypothetical protein